MVKKEIRTPVAIIGAGLSGICAAIALSRLNVQSVLVQDRSVLGGNSGPEICVPIGGADRMGKNRHARETGILDELLLENAHFPNVSCPETSQGFSCSVWDLVLRSAIWKEKNITLLMNTIAKNPKMKDGRIVSVTGEQNSTETEYEIFAELFLDCSGDGRVGAEAGAEYLHGQEGRMQYDEDLAPETVDSKTMGNSVYIRAKDTGKPMPFHAPPWVYTYHDDNDFPGGYADCPHDIKQLTGYPGGYWWIEFGGEFDTIHDSEFIHNELLRYAVGVWDHIKNHGDHGAENYVLDWISIIPGKRESRRFVGDYMLTQKDLEALRIFPDTVAYGGWNIDVHYPPGISGKGGKYWCGKNLSGLYAIPLSALYSVNIDNLMFAGRNISASRIAMGSTRVMATCSLMGQAIGNAAALCVKRKKTPKEVCRLHVGDVQQNLLKQDVYLPGFAFSPENNIACSAEITASSQVRLQFPEPEHYINADTTLYQAFFADQVDTIALPLRNTGEKAATAEVQLFLGKSISNLLHRAFVKSVKADVPPGDHWIEFPVHSKWTQQECLQLRLVPAEYLQWGSSTAEPPATMAGKDDDNGFALRGRGTFGLRLTPDSFCYNAEQMISGVNRPDAKTNLWIAEEGFPQTVRLRWSKPVSFSEIRLTFDDNLDRQLRRITDYQTAPELIKDYEIHVMVNGQWEKIICETDNYLRHRIHHLPSITTQKLKLVILSSNGCGEARLIELQISDGPVSK